MPCRNLSFLPLVLMWWLSLAPAAWAQLDVQDSGVDGAPGPIAANAARTPQDHRLKRDYAHTPIALSITLPPTTHAQQAASAGTQEPKRPGPLQIGFGRTLPGTYQGDLVQRLTWETRSDGTAISALSVASPEARALRIALRGTLPTGAEVRFFSLADPEQRFPPIQPQDVPAETPADAPAEEAAPLLWSPVIEGDTVGVEITLPSPAAVADVSLFIDRVSHLFASVRQATPRRLFDIGDAASCHIDVACRTTTPRTLAAATAKVIYTRPTGSSFLCTGVLMNDTDDSSFIPYFLTAHHCIDTQAVARTLDTYWEFGLASCAGIASSQERRSIKRHVVSAEGPSMAASPSFYPQVGRWLAPASDPSDHGNARKEAPSDRSRRRPGFGSVRERRLLSHQGRRGRPPDGRNDQSHGWRIVYSTNAAES